MLLGLSQRVQYWVFKASAAARQSNSSGPGFRRDELAGDESHDFIHVQTGVHRAWNARSTVDRWYAEKQQLTVDSSVVGEGLKYCCRQVRSHKRGYVEETELEDARRSLTVFPLNSVRQSLVGGTRRSSHHLLFVVQLHVFHDIMIY